MLRQDALEQEGALRPHVFLGRRPRVLDRCEASFELFKREVVCAEVLQHAEGLAEVERHRLHGERDLAKPTDCSNVHLHEAEYARDSQIIWSEAIWFDADVGQDRVDATHHVDALGPDALADGQGADGRDHNDCRYGTVGPVQCIRGAQERSLAWSYRRAARHALVVESGQSATSQNGTDPRQTG